MRVIQKQSLPSHAGDTRSIANLGTFLGKQPEKLGTVVKMFPRLSLSFLTEALGHVYKNGKTGKNKFQSINSMAVEWQIDVNFIKEVKITGAASSFSPVTKTFEIDLEEKYYDPNDSFQLENRQIALVLRKPKKVAANRWKHVCVLMGNDPGRAIVGNAGAAGKKTRYHSNFHPELSERGYTKFISSTEVHRNHLSIHRASVEKTNAFALQEYKYIEAGSKGKETYYKMEKAEDSCLKHYLESRERALLSSESNYDINGKCQVQDENGQDIPSGDGIITQVEKFAEKFGFNEMSTALFEDAIQLINTRVGSHKDNNYVLMCNQKFWYKFNRIMKNDDRFQKSLDNKFVKANGQGVMIGTTFNGYEFAGTKFTVMQNDGLDLEYPDYAFGIMLNVGSSSIEGSYSNLNMFTLEGKDIISGTLNGMGGLSGKADGDIATPVSASSYHLMGYAGSALLNPYEAVIFEEMVA